MTIWISAFALLLIGLVVTRFLYRRWRKKRIAARRRVELPNSHYTSRLVQHQIDRQRWGNLNVSHLHPVNREEVERLLGMVDALGPEALSPRERIFLDHLTSLRFG
jgi:hypothetical protein